MHLYKREKLITGKNIITACVSFLIVVIICLVVTGNMSRNNEEKEKEILLDAINNAALLCYSIEGKYPESIEYIEDNYGIIYDHDKYWVSYSIFASNMKPQVSVYEQ